jgi:hypothetical protein
MFHKSAKISFSVIKDDWLFFYNISFIIAQSKRFLIGKKILILRFASGDR